MQSRLKVSGFKNLYDFWGSKIYHALTVDSETIVNLSSEEYAKVITPYLLPEQKFVTVVFGSVVDGKLKTKATLAKMARGEMVRFMAENKLTKIKEIEQFNHPDWKFSKSNSTENRLVFVYQK